MKLNRHVCLYICIFICYFLMNGTLRSEWNPFHILPDQTMRHAYNPNPVPIKPVAADQISGDPFWLEIHIGDAAIPVDSLYGVSLAIQFESDIVHPTGLIESGSFLGSASEVQILTPIVSGDTLFTAITRTDTGNTIISGTGTILRVQFISDTLISDRLTCFELIQTKAVEPDWSEIPIDPGETCIILTGWIPVWPGDTDNSGYVDQADLLPIGLSWAQTGYARLASADSIQWESVLCRPWNHRIEYTYADANGDGIVDEEDVLPVGCFWHCRQGQSCDTICPASQSIKAVSLSVQGSISHVDTDDEIELTFHIQDASHLLGISLQIEYPFEQAQILSITKGELIGEAQLMFQHEIPEQNVLAISICRSRLQGGVSGAGDIARMRFLKTSVEETIQFNVRKASGMDAFNSQFPIVIEPFEIGNGHQPDVFELSQNYPNPFNHSTMIPFHLSVESKITLRILNVLGEEVVCLLDGSCEAGFHQIKWDGTGMNNQIVASGIYYFLMEVNGHRSIHKGLFLK